MIIHELIKCFLRHQGGSREFFEMQAVDAVRWLEREGVALGAGVTVLDLGCGFGDVGAEVARRGATVTMADDDSFLREDFRHLPFTAFDIDKGDFSKLGEFDVAICSNVLEHLPRPQRLLDAIPWIVKPGGCFYLSWTNWLSPWGGHEFSPWHYLGPRTGSEWYDRLVKGPRLHWPYQNLFPTHIGSVLRALRADDRLTVERVVPRYYPEFAVLMRVPVLREFLAWNCAVLVRRRG